MFYKKKETPKIQTDHALCHQNIYKSHYYLTNFVHNLSPSTHLFWYLCKKPIFPVSFRVISPSKEWVSNTSGQNRNGPCWRVGQVMYSQKYGYRGSAPISLTKANNISRLWAVSQAQDLSGALLRGVDHLLYCRTRILPAIFHKPFSVGIDVILISMLLV